MCFVIWNHRKKEMKTTSYAFFMCFQRDIMARRVGVHTFGRLFGLNPFYKNICCSCTLQLREKDKRGGREKDENWKMKE